MARRDIKITSVTATNKDNNVMRISLKVGSEEVQILRDCTNKGVYAHINDYIKSNSLQVTKRFEEYETSPIESSDIDLIAKKLTVLAGGSNKSGYDNFELNQFMRVITA